jgi:hypothetical protein
VIIYDTVKQCCTCKESKPLTEFGNNKSSPDGHQRRCLTCARASSAQYYANNKDKARAAVQSWQERNPDRLREASRRWREANPEKMALARKRANLRFFYDLTLDEYEALLTKGCQVCGSIKQLHVDHDHSCCPSMTRGCGKCVRGILCRLCNMAIGMFRDDPKLLEAAAKYLSEYNSPKKTSL